MPKLVKYVPVRKGLDTVWLSPGDDLPEWAVGLVGDHALSEDVPETVSVPVADEKPAAVKAKSTEAPDFTGSAPRRTRPRK